MKTSPPLKVSLHGMDERAQRIFDLFLQGPARGSCEIVPEGQQEAVVVDLDGVGTERLWLDVRRRFSGPALVLSVREKELRNSIWVSKPVQASEFVDAVKRVQTELMAPRAAKQTEQTPANKAITQQAKAPESAPAEKTAQPAFAAKDTSSAAHAAELTMQERHIHECCGDTKDEVYRDPARRSELFYDPADTLLGAILEAISLANEAGTPARIDGLGHPLVICPDQRRFFTDMREPYIRSLCTRRRSQTPMPIQTISLEDTPVTAPADERLQRLDALLWSVALWTARGRIPLGTSLEAAVKLKGWPNLTRFTIIPGAMQIAALWSRRPTGLMKTAEQLKLPYRYVFSFYSACKTLGLAEQVALPESAANTEKGPLQSTPSRRGLFKRMLNKLGLG